MKPPQFTGARRASAWSGPTSLSIAVSILLHGAIALALGPALMAQVLVAQPLPVLAARLMSPDTAPAATDGLRTAPRNAPKSVTHPAPAEQRKAPLLAHAAPDEARLSSPAARAEVTARNSASSAIPDPRTSAAANTAVRALARDAPDSGEEVLPLAAGAGAFVLPTQAHLVYRAADDSAAAGTTLQLDIRFDGFSYQLELEVHAANGDLVGNERSTGILREFGFTPLDYRRSGGSRPVALMFDWSGGQVVDQASGAHSALAPGMQDGLSWILQTAMQLQATQLGPTARATLAWHAADGSGEPLAFNVAGLGQDFDGADLPVDAGSVRICPQQSGNAMQSAADRGVADSADAGGNLAAKSASGSGLGCIWAQHRAYMLPLVWQRKIGDRLVDFKLRDAGPVPARSSGDPSKSAPT